ncbi:hypothetical protein KA107_03270 [Candidatus Pacearchaeota archaeon]|nr:hypothetical protein [Candidatus Pacearchaeota archaeon]
MGIWYGSSQYDRSNNRIGWTVIVGLASLLIGGCWSTTNKWEYSVGAKVGVINKVSHKGLVGATKTWEAEMAAEGLVSDGQSSGANLFNCSIDNYWPKKKQDELARQLEEARDSGKKVKINYTEMLKTFPTRSGSDHLIQSIEVLSNTRNYRETSSTQVERTGAVEGKGNLAVTLDGRSYNLKHDISGKLRVSETREVQ